MIIDHNEQTIETLLKLYNKILNNTTPLSNDGVARSLLMNNPQVTSPIAIDKYFGIEISYGISISFSARSTTFLFEAVSNELNSGFLAVSSSGDIGLIYRDNINKVSNVILISRCSHADVFFTTLWGYWTCAQKEDIILGPPDVSINELNEIFHERTGLKSVANFIYNRYKVYKIAKDYDVLHYRKRDTVKQINNFVAGTDNYRFNVYRNGMIDEETFKYAIFVSRLIFRVAISKDLDHISKLEQQAFFDIIGKGRFGPRALSHILNVKHSEDLEKIRFNSIRIMKIENEGNSYFGNKNAYVFKLKSGLSIVFFNNAKVVKKIYRNGENMKLLGDIPNDDYAFQLLEWRYVGQTTIIEPTPQ